MMHNDGPDPKRAQDDDELALELPPSTGEGADSRDPDFKPEDDSDLGLDAATGPEGVGLDDTTGLREPEEHELATSDDEESTRWTDGGEAAGELDGEEDAARDEPEDSEDGWTDGNDPVEEGGFDDGVITLDESGTMTRDDGHEGLSDDGLDAELDTSSLPPLDSEGGAEQGDEGEPQDLESYALDLIGGSGNQLDDEDTTEVAEGLFCTRLAPSLVQLEQLHEAGQPLIALAATAHHGLMFSEQGLHVTGADQSVAEARFGAARALWDLVAAETGGSLFVALATPEGLLCSHDGGASFTPAGSLPGGELPPNRLAITRDGDDLRLWAAAAEGALCASDDGGRNFAAVLGDARVLRLASDGRRALSAIARDDDGTAVAEHTVDGGSMFERLELPAGEIERLQDVQVCRETVLACRRAPEPRLLIGSAEEPWLELLPHAEPPAALVDEDGRTVAYCCVLTDDGQLLLRRALDGGLTPQVVARLPAETGAAVQLRGCHVEGVTTLHVGGERSWLRVTLRAAGRGRSR